MSGHPRTASNRCPPVSEWPVPDQTAWAAALQPGDGANQSSLATRWSEATRHMVVKGYGMWLTWLGTQSLLDSATLPPARITAEHVSLYIADLQQGVGAFTVAVRVEQLGNAMRAMAPEGHWHWLQRIADRLRAGAKKDRAQARSPAPVSCPPNDADHPMAADMMSNRCMRLGEWPAPDQAAWAAALQPGDALGPGGVAATWAAATQRLVVNGYGRWLTWLSLHGGLDLQLSPTLQVTRPRLLAYTRDLQATVASFTVATRIEQLGNAMRALAPNTDWRWIQRGADRLRVGAVSVRDKRARLQSPEQVLAFAMTLMAQAEDPARGSPAVRAASCRDGLLIALLAQRPMRRCNVTAILCGEHLVRRGTTWWLVFPAAETKTRRALEFTFPPDLVAGLQHYLVAHRPVLLACGDRHTGTPVTALWVSKHGTHMGYAAIGHQVSQRTAAAFGRSMSPHLFRDAVTTDLAIRAPAEIQLIPSLLGHTTLATSQRHYNLAGSLEAGRRYAATIAALRTPKPDRKPK